MTSKQPTDFPFASDYRVYRCFAAHGNSPSILACSQFLHDFFTSPDRCMAVFISKFSAWLKSNKDFKPADVYSNTALIGKLTVQCTSGQVEFASDYGASRAWSLRLFIFLLLVDVLKSINTSTPSVTEFTGRYDIKPEDQHSFQFRHQYGIHFTIIDEFTFSSEITKIATEMACSTLPINQIGLTFRSPGAFDFFIKEQPHELGNSCDITKTYLMRMDVMPRGLLQSFFKSLALLPGVEDVTEIDRSLLVIRHEIGGVLSQVEDLHYRTGKEEKYLKFTLPSGRHRKLFIEMVLADGIRRLDDDIKCLSDRVLKTVGRLTD